LKRDKSPKKRAKKSRKQQSSNIVGILLYPFIALAVSFIYPLIQERVFHGKWPEERSWYQITVETIAGFLFLLPVVIIGICTKKCCAFVGCGSCFGCCGLCNKAKYYLCGEVDEDSDEEL
jgi:sugar phosphate permease